MSFKNQFILLIDRCNLVSFYWLKQIKINKTYNHCKKKFKYLKKLTFYVKISRVVIPSEERVFLLEITEHVQMKNIFSKNVFKKQFEIHIYSNYSSKDYRVSVMFRLRITRIFPRYSSASLLLECSRSAGKHRAMDPTKEPGITNRKFLLLLLHRLAHKGI